MWRLLITLLRITSVYISIKWLKSYHRYDTKNKSTHKEQFTTVLICGCAHVHVWKCLTTEAVSVVLLCPFSHFASVKSLYASLAVLLLFLVILHLFLAFFVSFKLFYISFWSFCILFCVFMVALCLFVVVWLNFQQ